jgi:hypothetical protein
MDGMRVRMRHFVLAHVPLTFAGRCVRIRQHDAFLQGRA